MTIITKKKNEMYGDVILTFDKLYDDETEIGFEFHIEVSETDGDIRKFVTDKIMKEVANFIEDNGYEKKWLSRIATYCEWGKYQEITGNTDLTELGNVFDFEKFNFAECEAVPLDESSLSYAIKQKYGFGKNTDCSWFWENRSRTSWVAYSKYLLANSGIKLETT